jgi:ComF family protein
MTSVNRGAGVSAIWQGLLHLLYPKICIGCGTDLIANNQLLCLDCMEALPLTNFLRHDENPVEKIFRGRLNISSAFAYLYFTKQSVMQHVLHQLKYQGNKEVGYYFGRRMGKILQESSRYNDVQGLVPLPLFYKKEKKRGYNQSTLICEGMSEVMKIPILDKVVKRKMATETQTRKNRKERWENIEGKFVLEDEKEIEGKHVLLVDDVLTTGATLEACGAELLKAQNVQLGIVTLAYTSS